MHDVQNTPFGRQVSSGQRMGRPEADAPRNLGLRAKPEARETRTERRHECEVKGQPRTPESTLPRTPRHLQDENPRKRKAEDR